MKPIRFTKHALEQCVERGADRNEVVEAIRTGRRETAKQGRVLCRANFQFNRKWQRHFYPIKQVVPVIVDDVNEIIVITVYTFYF
jgi:hypothetical protein